MNREYGSQSMTGKLKKVLVKRPEEGPEEAKAWQAYGYLHEPDLTLARQEHQAFVNLLEKAGVEVIYAQEKQAERLDSIFTYDPALVTDAGAVIGRMGKALRRGEELAMAREFLKLGLPILYTIHGQGTLEGGDTLWLDPHTLLVGRSYRTNEEGIGQLRQALKGLVDHIYEVPLPHWRGPAEVLHLLSLISPVDEDLAVVYPPLMPITLLDLLKERHIELLPVPDEEFETMGCNILALAPRQVIMLAGNPVTADRLREKGVEVWEYEGQEISLNRAGGPTCLTRPILREY